MRGNFAQVLSRITEYRNRNRVLRQTYGPAARNTISKNKSHIRALRSTYNNAAPIHRCLPPEVLMEVFSHIHPAMMPRLGVPVLRVCRYWRRLLFRTPRFWVNLLNLPTWEAWNPKHDMDRFGAALSRSAPESLELSVPYYSQSIVDTLAPHASRLSSFKAGPTLYDRIEQRMPCLVHLPISGIPRFPKPTLIFRFSLYPNIQSLDLQHTYFFLPVILYPSLRHLRLDHCAGRPSSSTDGFGPRLRDVRNALQYFPNLETLSLTCSLSGEDPHAPARSLPLSPLAKTVHLSRLRHLELKDVPDCIHQLLSHLAFPSSTSLALEPTYAGDFFSALSTAIPLSPGFDHSPAPHADSELSLHLVFRGPHDERLKFARWETRGGAGVRPVRVTLLNTPSSVRTIARYTREFAAALAPGLQLTHLTAAGWGASSIYRYWDDLVPALSGSEAGLRRLAYAADWTETQELVWQLEKRRRGDRFACPALEELALQWHLPARLDFSQEGEDWEALRGRDEGGPWRLHQDEVEPVLARSLRTFCDAVRACLEARAGLPGRCAPLRRLEVMPCPSRFDGAGVVLDAWQMALVEERLRDKLSDLVEDIAVVRSLQ